MRLATLLKTALLILFLGSSAWAQNNTALERFDRQLEQIRRKTLLQADTSIPADQRLLLDYGGSLSYSFASIDDSTFASHVFHQVQLVAFARMNMDGVHQFFIRGSSTYRDFTPGSDSFNTHGDDWVQVQLDRAVYQFDLNRYLNAYTDITSPVNINLKAGRQFVNWFTGMTLSQTLDGVRINVEWNKLTFKSLIAKTLRRSVDLDSSRPNFDGDTKRQFMGGALSVDLSERHQPYVYGLIQTDRNNSDPLTSTVLGTVVTNFFYDSWYLGAGSRGSLNDQLLYEIEFVHEGGQSLSNSFDHTGAQITQTKEAIDAFALDARLDYLLQDDNHSRLGLEIMLASGDTDRLTTTSTFGGNQSGTNDHAFNGFGLLNTGLAFSPTLSNLVIFRLGGSTFPMVNAPRFKRMQVGTNLFFYNKFDDQAPIAEASRNHRFLGFEQDLFVNWKITSDLSMAARYGAFFAGSALANTNHIRHFFFTSMTLAF